MVAQAAGEGNEVAREVLARACQALGWGIAQAITLVSPEVVVIGGGVSLMDESLFLLPLRREVERYVFPPLAGTYRNRAGPTGRTSRRARRAGRGGRSFWPALLIDADGALRDGRGRADKLSAADEPALAALLAPDDPRSHANRVASLAGNHQLHFAGSQLHVVKQPHADRGDLAAEDHDRRRPRRESPAGERTDSARPTAGRAGCPGALRESVRESPFPNVACPIVVPFPSPLALSSCTVRGVGVDRLVRRLLVQRQWTPCSSHGLAAWEFGLPELGDPLTIKNLAR